MKVILFQQDARDCLNKKEVWGFCKKEAFLPLCSVYLRIMMSCWDFRMSYVLLSDICDTPRVTFIDLDFTSISSTPSRLHQRLLNIFVSDPPPLLFWWHMTWFMNRNRDNITMNLLVLVGNVARLSDRRVRVCLAWWWPPRPRLWSALISTSENHNFPPNCASCLLPSHTSGAWRGRGGGGVFQLSRSSCLVSRVSCYHSSFTILTLTIDVQLEKLGGPKKISDPCLTKTIVTLLQYVQFFWFFVCDFLITSSL